ncbi:MAG: energy transducer TonB [Methylococcaceae bacterium]
MWYFFNVSKTEHKKPLVVMEVAMLQKSESNVKQLAKEPSPVQAPVKKKSIKSNPVVKPSKPIKKPVVVKKTTAISKRQLAEIKEVIPMPKFEPVPTSIPTPAVVAPAPSATSNSRAAAKTTETTGHGRDAVKTVVSGVVPLVRVPPKYPARAASRHIEGWVKVEFTIQTDGSVDDAVVAESEPEDIFDDAALTAIGKWKFKEKIVNGIAVPQRAVQKLQFKLEQ